MSANFETVISEFLKSNLGILIAGGGLIFTGIEFFKSRKQRQLDLLSGIYKDIMELERRLGELDPDDPKYVNKRTNWASLFFNTLEWFAFLINRREIKKRYLVEYFRKAVIDWYENVFEKLASEDAKKDEGDYPEFKKLYKRFKSS